MPTRDEAELELPLRIIVNKPVTGVAFCLRGKNDEMVDRKISDGEDLCFEASVRVKRISGGPPRFLGPLIFGPTTERFVYIRIGTLAGQPSSCWTRAAKVMLSGISWTLIERAREANARLEARLEGRAKDGGPLCATVPLLDGGWCVKT